MLLACGPVYWGMVQVTHNDTVPLQSGDNSQTVIDNIQYSSCDFNGAHKGKITCPNPVEMYHDSCLDPNECYSVRLYSPNKNIAYLEMDLGGSKTKGDEVALCSGASEFAPNRCDLAIGREFDDLN